MASTATLRWMRALVSDHLYFFIVCPSIAYLGLVRYLRFRNLQRLEARFPAFVKSPNSMDYKTAHEILKVIMLQEFPFMYAFSTQWALIKSYGIASGTKLLVQTRRLIDEKTVGKRSEDTGVILGEILIQGVDTERGMLALSKMNWLHARYGTKISNGDLIHTLGLFVLEPHRWISIYEWRPMTEMEKVATFIYWKEIGHRMGMVGIPATLDELKRWMIEYEQTAMIYAESNRKCYDATVGLFLRNVPRPLRGFANQVSSCFLEPYVRRAMAVEDPSAGIESIVSAIWAMRASVVRNSFLPRLKIIDPSYVGTNGRIRRKLWLFEPWYVEESFWSSFQRKIGLPGPLPSPQYTSNGYIPEELGPKEFEKVSVQAVRDQAREMKCYAERGGGEGLGCPFSLARSV